VSLLTAQGTQPTSGSCWLHNPKLFAECPIPKSTHAKNSLSFRKEAERTAIEERAIQRRIDRSDEKGGGKSKKKDGGAMQAGARIYPVPPLRAGISRNRARSPISSSDPCTTRLITRARTNFSTR
jgi:hypothetical protein